MKIRLEKLIEKVVDQVWGSDERRLLYDFLRRNATEQIVEISRKDWNEIRVKEVKKP